MQKKSPPSAADKEEAERLKTEGNNLMRTEKFVDALEMYSKVARAASWDSIVWPYFVHSLS